VEGINYVFVVEHSKFVDVERCVPTNSADDNFSGLVLFSNGVNGLLG